MDLILYIFISIDRFEFELIYEYTHILAHLQMGAKGLKDEMIGEHKFTYEYSDRSKEGDRGEHKDVWAYKHSNRQTD